MHPQKIGVNPEINWNEKQQDRLWWKPQLEMYYFGLDLKVLSSFENMANRERWLIWNYGNAGWLKTYKHQMYIE